MRVTNAAASRKRRKRMVTAAKGYRARRSNLYRYASDAVDHGRQYAYRDRRVKKRTFRYLWQVRINAATRAAGQYALIVAGVPGYNYVVQASTDLVNWVPVQTNTAPFTFVDTNASQFGQRFYRSVYAP